MRQLSQVLGELKCPDGGFLIPHSLHTVAGTGCGGGGAGVDTGAGVGIWARVDEGVGAPALALTLSAVPLPLALTARTLKLYDLPLTRLVNVWLLLLADFLTQVLPPSMDTS